MYNQIKTSIFGEVCESVDCELRKISELVMTSENSQVVYFVAIDHPG